MPRRDPSCWSRSAQPHTHNSLPNPTNPSCCLSPFHLPQSLMRGERVPQGPSRAISCPWQRLDPRRAWRNPASLVPALAAAPRASLFPLVPGSSTTLFHPIPFRPTRLPGTRLAAGQPRERPTHPRVLMKPLTEPSAYRETMSPMCRKLDISFMVALASARRRFFPESPSRADIQHGASRGSLLGGGGGCHPSPAPCEPRRARGGSRSPRTTSTCAGEEEEEGGGRG